MSTESITPAASEQIFTEVSSWPGVTVGELGSRGEKPIRFERRELGHLHGDRVLHIGFPSQVWHELYDAGRIDYHPVFPGKVGWAARQIRDDDDVRDVIALVRINYDRSLAKS